MEIAWIIGILAAFVIGAYIRQPFVLVKKNTEQPQAKETPEEAEPSEEEKKRLKKEKNRIGQLENMLSYIGRSQDDEN
jgi:uncharacterized protein YlxW (UPF0749 family)